jgi:diacylglycerol kinase (ATP)
MMERSSKQFTPGSRLRSIGYALHGMLRVFRFEQNARIHLVAAGIVTTMGFLFHLKKVEWELVILCIGLVIGAEMMNTAIERLVDLVSPQKNEKARLIKDISAGAVLFTALIALITGLIIFIPYFWGCF